MIKHNVLVLTPCEEYNQEKLEQTCGEWYTFTFAADHPTLPREKLIEEADVIIGEPDYKEICHSNRLKWVQMTWAGTDKYTRNGPFPDGVRLSYASGAFGVIISEYILAGILSLYRQFSFYKDQQKKHQWTPLKRETLLFGKKVLLLGTGNIASETAKRLKAFDCETIGLRSKKEALPYFDQIDTLNAIDRYLPDVDIVIGALPNNDSTIGTMTYERFMSMKADAIFVNVGRGALVCEDALEKALLKNHLAGAVLDVHRVEPLSSDSPLWDMERVLITPHIAGPSFSITKDTEKRIYDICIENLLNYKDGNALRNEVNFSSFM